MMLPHGAHGSPGRVIAPGAILGVLGGGQLGRMFAIAARRMGYRVHTFSPDEDTPTGHIADLEVTGQGVITLQAASTATDGNFIVYLEDVAPDGKVTYVTEGLLRALHRKLSTEPAPYKTTDPYRSYNRKDGMPLVPGEAATLTFQLLPTSVLFKAGHRIRVAIAGADKDTFLRLPAQGDVTITVSRGGSEPSFVDLPVVR